MRRAHIPQEQQQQQHLGRRVLRWDCGGTNPVSRDLDATAVAATAAAVLQRQGVQG